MTALEGRLWVGVFQVVYLGSRWKWEKREMGRWSPYYDDHADNQQYEVLLSLPLLILLLLFLHKMLRLRHAVDRLGQNEDSSAVARRGPEGLLQIAALGGSFMD